MARKTADGIARVRMVDIAEMAGVSRPAVSYVLNGSRGSTIGVSPETAERIRRIAKELNYHPNQAARQLAGKRSRIVGALANTWFLQTELRTLSWLNHLASPRGLKVLAAEIEGQTRSLEEYVDECLGWNIDGLIYVAAGSAKHWPALANTVGRLPRVISVLADAGIPNSYCIRTDPVEGTRLALNHLFQQGRRRVVLVLENLEDPVNILRRDAFLAIHREHNRDCDANQICVATGDWTEKDMDKYADLCRQLVQENKADAIVADSDYTAAGLINGLSRIGLRIPQDVALVGWGNETLAPWLTPRLTTISFNMQRIMAAALDLLGALCENPEIEQERVTVIQPTLMVRHSA